MKQLSCGSKSHFDSLNSEQMTQGAARGHQLTVVHAQIQLFNKWCFHFHGR